MTQAAARVLAASWDDEADAQLRGFYERRAPVSEIADALGRSGGSIRNRAYKLRITADQSRPTALWDDLRALYERAGEDGVLGLDALVIKWGRSRSNLCRAASKLGLTNQRRRRVEQLKDRRKYGDLAAFRKVASEVSKERIAKNGHPRGMLGKRHTEEVRAKLSKSSKGWWASLSVEQKDAQVTSNLKAALAKNGKIGPISGGNREGATWKAGWRDIGSRRIYFRSRWEANYARYLEWLKAKGDILEWEYEPETFWFEAIKRGVRSYKPDFRVHELSGAKPLHEVKGWMDARSKTTLKRMAKYHPQETIILIRDKEYRAISRFSAMIGGWE
jgi:hypothetical protein